MKAHKKKKSCVNGDRGGSNGTVGQTLVILANTATQDD